MAKVLIGNFKGPKGDQGVKGDPGTAASIQVGTVQTVQPEENAEVTNTGTTSAAVLNFKIPRGKDGMTDLTAEYTDDSSYTCQPTVNAPVVVKGVDGKTEQVETTGKNLFNINGNVNTQGNDYQQLNINTVSGNVLTCNVNGQKTNAVGQTISGLNSKTVTFSAKVISFGSGIEASIFVYENGGYNNNLVYAEEVNSVIKITCAISTDNPVFAFATINGTGAQFTDIQVEIGETNTDWEPYTGGSPAPSPDYPQVIKGVGGMGYFDGEWVQGNISSTGAIGTETTGITSANAIPCKQNDNIAVTYEDSIDVIAVAFYNASGAYISTSTSGNNVDTFTATSPANAASFKVNLRVVSGSTITPNGAKYCTVTINGGYQTGVEVTGKNLLNIEEWLESKGAEYTKNGNEYTIALNDAIFTQPLILFDEPQQITLSAEKIENITSTNVRFDLLNGTELVGSLYYTDKQITAIADSIRLNYSNGGNFKVKGLMLNTGSEPLPYQPYHHTALTIPLTSPLYSGDKICYVKPGESYVDADGDTVVADRILYGVYRENAVVVFDGSEDEGWTLNTETNDFGQYTIIGASGILSADGTLNASTGGISSNFGVSNQIGAGNEKSGAWIYNSTTVALVLPKDLVEYNVSALKTWLSTNPLTVVYRLAQPYFEPFTDQSIFYNLRTDDTISYIYSNDPIEPNVTVEVAKNETGGILLESYAQAQKNAISEANSQSRLSAIEQQLVNQATTPTE